MTTEKELIEYFSQDENLEIILKIEPLISKIKNHKYRKSLTDDFMPLVKEKFNNIKVYREKDDLIISIDSQLSIKPAIYIGTDENCYYGIIADHDLKDTQLDKFIKENKMHNEWEQWLCWKNFSLKRDHILTKRDSELKEFYESWIKEFTEFYDSLKKLNSPNL